MKKSLLALFFASILFFVGCSNKQPEENYVEYGKTDFSAVYYDVNSLTKSGNIVNCKVKRVILDESTGIDYITNNYEIDYDNKTITRTNTVSVEKNGKRYTTKGPSTESFKQYNKRNQEQNIIKTMAQYYEL